MFKTKKLIVFVFFLLGIFIFTGCIESDSKIEQVYTELFDNVDLAAVDSDLSFPKSLEGVEITYNSNNQDVISNEGRVSRSSRDEVVTIKITLKQDSEVVKKKVNIIVLKDHNLLIEEVYNKLFLGEDSITTTKDLDFKTLVDGVSITYESLDTDVITNEGNIKRSAVDLKTDVNVTLSSGDIEVVKKVEVVVLKDNSITLEQVYNYLFKDIDLTKVVADLDFKTIVDGISISYNSKDLSIISNTGKVTRSLEDKEVSVEVVLTYDDEILEKTITIKVLKDPLLVINNVYTSLFTGIDLGNLKSDLLLINNKDGVSISYESTNLNVISNTGVVFRGSEDKEVKIIIVLSFENIEVTKEIFVTVLKLESQNYPISNALAASDNQVVTVEGIIIGEVGENYYLHDGSHGIYLYRLGNGYYLGDKIRVTGTKTTFNGLHELTSINDIVELDTNVALPNALDIIYLDEIDKQSTLYNIDDLEIVDYDTIKSGKDIFITVKDSSNNTMEIIISKHTSTYYINEIANKLFGMTIGDKLNLSNVVSSYFNKFQLQVFSPDQVELIYYDGGTVTDPIDPYFPKSEDMRFLKDELDEFLTSGISPAGYANVLIIPISFIDYNFDSEDLDRLELAFFGTSEDTGWESVQSYYHKSSYGKFNFTGEILSPYQTNKLSTYYAKRYNDGIDADYDIIKAALEYYDDLIDYSLYDNNDDGYIDGLYFIYAAPTWYGEETGSDNDSDLWWAYVYQYYTEDYELYDGVEANYYMWSGIEFMDEAFTYGEYTDEYIEINASTYIHETGHMLGLYDYYDYEEDFGPGGGLGGADMMDYTVGDHNSFSKIMLDWVTPLVVSGKSTTVTINSFTESKDVILVSSAWNNSYFDEYFLIEFYTPTGLNEAHAGHNGLYSISGVRIIHVNASLNPDQTDGNLFLYDNSYTSKKILKIIEADNNNSIEQYFEAEDSDLFQAGNEFGLASNYRLANGSLVNFNIKILNITNDGAQIEIVFN
ncbi:MAG: M6 family metalloprotease domain-containing protein [Bacilli bacterium]